MSERTATSPTVRITSTEPERARASGTRISARASVLLIVVLIAATLAIAPMRAYLAQRERLVDLQRQAATLEASNRALEQRVGRLDDPKYLERLARECLGMVRPGEIAFVTVPTKGAAGQPDC
jgi:cell division protein FtsB